jgi:hypothetical protein
MNRRSFIETLIGALAAALLLRPRPKSRRGARKALGLKKELRAPPQIKHTVAPPPANPEAPGWRQYVGIDPADPNHSISFWARGEPEPVFNEFLRREGRLRPISEPPTQLPETKYA